MGVQGPLLASCLVAGVATGVATPVHWAPAAALAVALASLALVPESRAARGALGLAALTAAGACHGALARERAIVPPLVQWFDLVAGDAARSPDPVVVHGRLAADAAATDFGVRLLIDVEDVDDAADRRPAAGRVQAYVAGELATASVRAWTAGRSIQLPITLRRPQVLVNPGGSSELHQALRRPFHLAGTVKSAALVSVERATWWHEAAAAVRWHVRQAVAHRLPREPAAAIVTAILIGDRAGLSDEVERRLQAAGTYHVIAISGGNVALLVLITIAGMRLVVRPHRTGLLLALFVVLAYGWVVGGEPSVQRAVGAASVYLLARLAGLLPQAIHVLATVAAALALIDPLTTVDVGAWLSFGATLGIIVYGKDLGLRFTKYVKRSPRSFSLLLGATLAAELVLMPIGAAVFSRVSLAGLILNFVAIPAMAVVQLAGMLVVILDSWWGSGAGVAATVAELAATWLVGSAGLVDWIPWLSWRVPPTALGWTVAYYIGWVVALWPSLQLRLRRLGLAIAVPATIVVMTAPEVLTRSAPGGFLRVTMIDVGQGDAIAVQFPSGHSLLVDSGGSAGPFDIGGRVVTPTLWALGIRRLDWLAITHADLDHIGGARAVVADLAPREIWEGVPVPRSREVQDLQADARASGATWRILQSGDRIAVGEATLHVAHPPLPDWERQKVRNDDSIVLQLTYGHVEFLLTGDAGREFEHRAGAEASHAPLRILKVAHHGSRTSTSSDFLDAFQPQISLISAGRGNLFGHPAPDILARLTAANSQIFRTDRDAAILVDTNGHLVHVRTMTGRSWQLRTLPK